MLLLRLLLPAAGMVWEKKFKENQLVNRSSILAGAVVVVAAAAAAAAACTSSSAPTNSSANQRGRRSHT